MHRALRTKALAALAVLSACFTSAAVAGEFPDKPIWIVVPFSTGGTADTIARSIGNRLSERVGKPVIIDNRPGAGTAIGVKHAALAPPDGYTILYGGVSSQVMNPLISHPPFDPVKDFTPITLVNSLPLVLVVRQDLPVDNFQQFLALAKSSKAPLSYGSAGAGTSNHLAGELLKYIARVPLLHVPYKSSAPALADLLGGHVDAMFDLVLTSAPQVKQGKIKAIAITSAQRSALLPQVPTMGELGMPNAEVDVWTGFFGPAGIPAPIVARLNHEIVAILNLPEVKEQFSSLGARAAPTTPEELGALLNSELKKWDAVIKAAHISAQ